MHSNRELVSMAQYTIFGPSVKGGIGLQEALGDPHNKLEFEVNLNPLNLGEDAFRRVYNAFAASAAFRPEGVGVISLDISVDGLAERLSIQGAPSVEAFCTNPYSRGSISRTVMAKREVKRVPIPDFGLVVNLKHEEALSGEEAAAAEDMLLRSTMHLRHKQRSSFVSDKYAFRVDLTVVRQGADRPSELMRRTPRYEVEVELVERSTSVKEATSQLERLCMFILKNVDNTHRILSLPEKDGVLADYQALCHAARAKPGSGSPVDAARMRRSPHAWFLGPKPVTLMSAHLRSPDEDDPSSFSITRGYNVTDKADGERVLAFINAAGRVYLIDNRLGVRDAGVSVPGLAASLLDGEYVDRWKVSEGADIFAVNQAAFMAFDIYWYQGNAVTAGFYKAKAKTKSKTADKDKDTRYELMIWACKQLADASQGNPIRFSAKSFFFSDDIHESVRLCTETPRLYETDGLIFTPNALPVGANHEREAPVLRGTWRRVLKWKPPELNTIDFLTRATTDGTSAVSDAATFSLWVGMAEARGGSDPIGVLSRGQAGGGAGAAYVEHQFAVTEVPMEGGKCVCQNGDPIQSDTVVEFSYQPAEGGGGKWVPLRVRHDKTALYRTTRSIAGAANDYHIARNVMASILDPVSMAMLLGTDTSAGTSSATAGAEPVYYNRDTARSNLATLPMLNFHNHWVKNHSLIWHLRAAGAKKVLDIACGKGGDLFKYVNAGCRVVVGIDISPDNLLNPDDGAYARLAEMRSRQRDAGSSITAVFLQMDCGKPLEAEHMTASGQLRDINSAALGFVPETRVPRSLAPFYKIATGGFDAACCMFGIHYFFEKPESLDTLAATLRSRVKRGGLLLLTFMDGAEVDRLLARAGSLVASGKKDGKVIWSIAKRYDALSEDPLENYGKSIDVFVESINQTLPEYLVDPRLLRKVLEAHEFQPLSKESAKKLGFASDTGLFGDLFEAMASSAAARGGGGGGGASAEKVQSALGMSADERRFSFLNRWAVFQAR